MVRHHVKKSKKGGAAGKQAAPSEVSKAELDRFAGSSDEDEDDNNSSDNDEEQDEELEPMNDLDDGSSSSDDGSESAEAPVQQRALTVRKEIARPSVSSDDDSSSDEDEEELVNQPAPSQVGMASAMSRILGTTMSSFQAKKNPDPSVVVLSRTTTPLQKAQLEEKSRLTDAKKKRSTNRERNLACMHVPLSVATTAVVGGSGSVARELEMERMHRRVATRGVVALFNAISQHKAETKQLEIQNVDPLKAAKKQKGADVSKLTKHGFLDMIRKTATDDTTKGETMPKPNDDKEQASTKKSGTSGGWSALKDDFMMNSKLKDWDKAMSEDGDSSSDDEQANAGGGVQDEWSDDDGGDKGSTRKRETEGHGMSSKKRRVRS